MHRSFDLDVLLVEDDPRDAQAVKRLLHPGEQGAHDEGSQIHNIVHVDRLDDALDRLESTPPDVVLLDLNLPDSDGLDTLEAVVERAPMVPVVVLTGETDIGIDAIRRGAQDYLIKGSITAPLLVRTLQYSVERAQTQRELLDRHHRLILLQQIIRRDIRDDVSMIVGQSDQLLDRLGGDDRAVVESILAASQHLLQLTDTAAELMDILAPAHPIEPEPCRLMPILEAELDRFTEAHDVELTFEPSDHPADPVIVAGSPTLGSVFEQLLSNAAIHTDRERPRVAVTVEVEPETVQVIIADDGLGLSEAEKAALAGETQTNLARSRLGAGLYLVTTVLDAIGGNLAVDDNAPRGTRVTVTLERASDTWKS